MVNDYLLHKLFVDPQKDNLLPIGKCCYCGYENEHYVCELCGTVYDDMGGDEHLCNGCMPRDD